MIERIIAITLPIFAIALVGFLYARAFKPDLSGANRISVDLALPALIFTSLSTKDFAFGESGLLLLASTLLIFASGLLAWPLARVAGADRRAFLPCVMFGNVGRSDFRSRCWLSAKPGSFRPCLCSCCPTFCISRPASGS